MKKNKIDISDHYRKIFSEIHKGKLKFINSEIPVFYLMMYNGINRIQEKRTTTIQLNDTLHEIAEATNFVKFIINRNVQHAIALFQIAQKAQP